MVTRKELEDWCGDVFVTAWSTRAGTKVPDEGSRLQLKNEGIEIEGTVLYADLADSTAMVDSMRPSRAAEIYKTFLYCAAKIIEGQGGVITAYDGDRVMAVFIGEYKNTSAAKAALMINWAVRSIVAPKMRSVYKDENYKIMHVTGIDTSSLLVAKTGIRGANDLVWVGRAANHAAKLSSLPATYAYMSEAVFQKLNKEAKVSSDGRDMWERRTWSGFNGSTIYRSAWGWILP